VTEAALLGRAGGAEADGARAQAGVVLGVNLRAVEEDGDLMGATFDSDVVRR
jgi:hypothetical protein